MTDKQFDWEPTAQQVEESVLKAFLRHTGEKDFDSLARRADADPGWITQQVLEFGDFRFYKPWDQILDTSKGIEWARWCVGGTTNLVLNCIDRHRGTPTWKKTFLIWEGEDPAQRRELTYEQFDAEVCKLANGLMSLGVGRGDRVALYMPNVPETFIAFFAVLKIGAMLVPMFSGFGPQPLLARLEDGEPKVVLTVDGASRRGKAAPIKANLDEALKSAPSVEHVVVLRNVGDAVNCEMTPGRDIDWAELTERQAGELATVEVPAEEPAVLFYTSGTSGKPKGCVWTHVGFLAAMCIRDMHICGDFNSDDRLFFLTDMGWGIGAMCACLPSYFGASVVLADGAPDYPDIGRFWRLLQDHRVTYTGVSPTLVRGLMRHGAESVSQYDLSALRITCSSAEPWNEASWRWFFEHACKKRLPIINAVGGTELSGCYAVGTVYHPMRPGSFSTLALGAGVEIVDDQGKPCPPGQAGEVVFRNPSIGMTKSLWRDDKRYIKSYWSVMPGRWVHGDLAVQDDAGLTYVIGRSDDTLKISGKRTAPSELETILTGTEKVNDAAVIGVPDEVKGSVIVCVCVLEAGFTPDAQLEAELSDAIIRGMGSSYRPKSVLFVSELPRNRSMKLLRRVVSAVYQGKDPGDLSSLVNPDSVEELRSAVAEYHARAES